MGDASSLGFGHFIAHTDAVGQTLLAILIAMSVASWYLILAKTSEMFSFPIEDIRGKSRRRPLVTARQIGMYVMREMTDLSYPAIAREFGGRDHTTVMHADRKIRELMAERRALYNHVNEITTKIKQQSSY